MSETAAIHELVRALRRLASDDTTEPLLTRELLAERLQISKRSVELLEAAGLPTIRFGAGGKIVRHNWRDVQAWLALETRRHVGTK